VSPIVSGKGTSESSGNDSPSHLLDVQGLSAAYGAQPILKSVSFQLSAGQTMVVLGESGCGKTTLLRALAGLVEIDDGRILLNQRLVSELSPRERGIIYLDQEPLLFEHLTVAENIAFAMRLKREPAERIQAAVHEMLDAIELREHAGKRDWQLSGGQKQRVAFARAVLARPELLLLDEPFCSLDGRTRSQMQTLFATISQRFRLTSVFVTHDVKESLIVGDQFARMSGGELFLYRSRDAFTGDRSTGIPDEIAFWKNQDHQTSDNSSGTR
jgi:putrescine transport system ATP-binding protein